MSPVITSMRTEDIRYPTSRLLDGSDAMNPDPDYSAAYLVLGTDDGLEGHSFVFTIGRGNDLQATAIAALEDFVVGRRLDELEGSMGAFARELIGDSQWRWLGPEKGVVHMAMGAVVDAVWDLIAKRRGLPLWQLLAEMTPDQLVELIDFRYLSDALTPDEARAILEQAVPHRERRTRELLERGYPAYTTAPGWLGYSDEKLRRLCLEAVAEGFDLVKLKVGANLDDDIRRLEIARDAVGPNVRVAVDANQRWDVGTAIEWMTALAPFDPYWIEEPTSPDDVLGHAAIAAAIHPIRVATGEHVQNRVIFKQLLQAKAVDVVQIDATRVGGVNEIVAILLMAAKFGVPVCPHAGGVGLCERVQHLSMFDFVAVSGSLEGRAIEHVAHLHEHFVTPIVIEQGRYRAPQAPGIGAEMHPASRLAHLFPSGSEWNQS